MKDYRITAKVRNNYLLSAIERAGYQNINHFMTATGISAPVMYDLVNLKIIPFHKTTGEWRPTVVRIAKVLKCMPADLFPPLHLTEVLERNTGTFEASLEDVQDLISGARQLAIPPDHLLEQGEEKAALHEAMSLMPERDQAILRSRFGFDEEVKTLDDLVDEWGISPERIRQIEKRAIRKLSTPNQRKHLAHTSQRLEAWNEREN